ncbi:MAG: TcpQ domain-containing protein, partial [Betaproteobacteria bacterium]
ARPAQVFDDGAGKVYFEARPGQAMPAVFVGKPLTLLVTTAEGQYFTAHTGESEFVLALGAARASVRRGDAALGAETISPRDADAGPLPPAVEAGPPSAAEGDERSPSAGDGAAGSDAPRTVSHEQPVVFGAGSAVLRPEVLEALSALVVRVGRDTPIAVVGRNDAGARDALSQRRAEALRNALLARGVLARHVQIEGDAPVGGDGAPRPHASSLRWQTTIDDRSSSAASGGAPFDVRVADRDIAATLRRWARTSGYEIVWDVRWAAPVNGAMRVDASTFLDAVRQVVAGLRAQGYPVQAQAYSDRVVRFTAAALP